VHRLLANGLIGEEVEQTQTLDTGIYAHQVRVSLSNKSVIVVARGNNAKENQPEDPGSLRVFSFSESGQLKTSSTVAPKQGYGFGPRHLDFHPSKPWVYVSLERQNGLHMYLANEMGDQVAEQPSYVKPTLSEEPGSRPRQRSGTVHVHPNGRSVYVANRASGLDSEQMYVGGENNIAVYRIDAISGEPTIIQHMDTRGVVARTFALDKTGTLLLAANSQTIRVKKDGQQTLIPASLALFHVLNDGSLAYVGKTDVPVGEEVLFWMGIA
jgi:6-phosphogluconolactonase (cycloisomerase 2 family)